ncbi:uncharacterized protein LOC143248619 isoform X2 [Tachypleus tridentatus]|uniref:uncharacterized protein LOC143248619 isoform X2 n=1 Tax=Tachypleus tridentatus TaxID=6853 RepID=UPI003FD1947F
MIKSNILVDMTELTGTVLRTLLVIPFLFQLTVSYGCQFPAKWTGLWFQKGLEPPIRIEGDTFSWRGKCIDSEGDLFLIDDNQLGCSRCVVIYEKHPNVLQYRETFCEKHHSLDDACAKLSVDAHLHSMFRVNAAPVPCPFRGPFTFSYSRGHGECNYPVSTIDPCTDDSKLLFRFQACVDVLKSESSEEELTCVATWKEGSAHYLVGKLVNKKNYRISYKDEDTYRCFIYDSLPDSYILSQSADATCDGLVSPREGYRTLRLTQSGYPDIKCQFPRWVTAHHRWHTLDDSKSYIFSHWNSSFRISHRDPAYEDSKVTCTEEVVHTSNKTVVVAYSSSGCNNGFVCLSFHRRDKHITELQIGSFVRRAEDACPPVRVSGPQEYITLVTSTPRTKLCPALAETNGLRVETGRLSSLPDKCTQYSTAVVGCRSDSTLEFLTTCASYRDLKRFQCHGAWEENGRTYLVTGLRESRRKYCFVFSAHSRVTRMSGLHDTCSRSIQPGITGNLTFNITAAGDCDYTLNAVSQITCTESLLFASLLAFIIHIR